MAAELNPSRVTAYLAELRARYQPETVEDARSRLQRERPPSTESFEESVARRLDELRALCDLIAHLGQVRFR